MKSVWKGSESKSSVPPFAQINDYSVIHQALYLQCGDGVKHAACNVHVNHQTVLVVEDALTQDLCLHKLNLLVNDRMGRYRLLVKRGIGLQVVKEAVRTHHYLTAGEEPCAEQELRILGRSKKCEK